MKKVLIVASVPSMIGQFNMGNIEILQELGYQVAVACNFRDRIVWDGDKIAELKKKLKARKVLFYQIDFARDALKIAEHFKAYTQFKRLVKKENYDLIHCHTPVVAAIARIVAHQTGTKIIYTAHGFHFFNGAPLKNWVLYYPVEKFLSRWTDCLITINREDYHRAKKKFRAKQTEYVPGVGIDLEKFYPGLVDVHTKRESLGVFDDDIVLFSAGELNTNKNHSTVIKAVARLKNPSVHYVIAGQGELKEELEKQAEALGIAEQVHLLGFRDDVAELMGVADIYCLPSLREGLNVSLMEAMASGLPCLASDIRGNRDLLGEGGKEKLLSPREPEQWADVIQKCINCYEKEEIGRRNSRRMEQFSKGKILRQMREIYKTMGSCDSD